MRLLIAFLGIVLSGMCAEVQVVAPPGMSTAGPYSPGLMVNDFLYISGQGPIGPDGNTPSTFDAQMRQALANVKAVVEAAGLTTEHIVYSHVYLTDMAHYERMNQIWSEFFSKTPPARAVLGVYRLPGDALVEINAVAFRDLSRKVIVPPDHPTDPASPGVVAGERVYLSGFLGADVAGKIPDDPGEQVQVAFEHMKNTLKAAGLDFRNMVFVNPYLTGKVGGVMNEIYATHFEFDNTPGRATIRANRLPLGANIEFTGVAIRDLSKRRAVRPKNMEPSATASPCVLAGDTYYCSAKSAFIPGPNLGIYMPTVDAQVRQTMRNLLDGLEEAGLTFANVVATNVYLDDMNDFSKMNRVYSQYFPGTKPTRTTVAQTPPRPDRGPINEDRYPSLEQISLIAVK